MSKRRRILFDQEDLNYINEMKAREYADRGQAQSSATVFAFVCLGVAGYVSKTYPKIGMGFFVAAFVFGIISWFANPDR